MRESGKRRVPFQIVTVPRDFGGYAPRKGIQTMYRIDFSHPVSVYFVGIGGCGMSSLARILSNAGFQVAGSDRSKSAYTKMLESEGVTVLYGQRAENITDRIDCAVYTSAVPKDNPERVALEEKNIPCLTRAQLLGQIMQYYQTPIAVSGTHGKTTTASMISEILLQAGLDPTVSVGGILKSIGGNSRVGNTGYMVAEADEYTNSFLDFHPKIGVILNIEEDHPDFFKDLADIRSSFRRFAQLLPADGCLIINGDIPDVGEITEGLPCRVITYGGTDRADYYPEDITYDQVGCPSFTLRSPGRAPRRFTLGVRGEHNVSNALAALALADLLSIDDSVINQALLSYHGADRRFEYKGTVGGVTIFDDFAHHPTEISATLKTAAKYPHNRIWCVFQPHTYTRTKALLKQFAEALTLADRVVLADIYPSREPVSLGASLGIHSRMLQQEIQALGRECDYFPTFDEIENFLLENCIKGDLLITMGAGDVVKIGENLLGN